MAVAAHVEPLKGFIDLAFVLGGRYAQEVHVAIAAHHHHVLNEDGKVPVDFLTLRDVSHITALERLSCGQARDMHLAVTRVDEPHDGLEEGRLAAAVDTDETADCAGA